MRGASGSGRVVRHETVEQRKARGKAQRVAVPHEALSEVVTGARDVVALLEGQAETRVAELVPIRYGRMLESPFAFYRGAALPMAADLSRGASTALDAQLCGDAHLSNFGLFASPDRRLMFDLNDFDETHPGPFEWDVKRLATSVEVAARGNGYKPKKRRAAVLATIEAYRSHMRRLAKAGNLEVWYERVEYEQMLATARAELPAAAWQRLVAGAAKATTRDSIQVMGKLTEAGPDGVRFMSAPPLLLPIRDMGTGFADADMLVWLRDLVRKYRSSLQPDRRQLLEQFRVVDAARKVVGVGSVGTRAWVLLALGRDDGDPLFLQAKEAQTSVLAPYVAASPRFRNEGERVVAGQHLMQAASDIFLGSLRTTGIDGVHRDFYVRQLRDWKLSATPSVMEPETMLAYGRLCGHVLARAHARSGDRVALAAYLGSGDGFDQALAEFASSYADVTEADHAALEAAAAAGTVEVVRGL